MRIRAGGGALGTVLASHRFLHKGTELQGFSLHAAASGGEVPSHAAASGRDLGRMRRPPAETWVACGGLQPGKNHPPSAQVDVFGRAAGSELADHPPPWQGHHLLRPGERRTTNAQPQVPQ